MDCEHLRQGWLSGALVCDDCGWQITPDGAQRVARNGDSIARRKGVLIQLRFRRSAAARRDALASIRQLPNGRWSARIGGRMQGATYLFWTRAEAERAVHAYYSERLLEALKAINQLR